MNDLDFAEGIEAAKHRMRHLQHQAHTRDRAEQMQTEAYLQEVQTSLEELQVAQEELRQQNEELLAMRQRLEAERGRYQDLFDFAPEGYLVTDMNGIIKEANQAACTLLNKPIELLIGKPFALWIATSERPEFRSQLAFLPQKDRIQDWEVRLQPQKGASFQASLTVAVMRDSEGSPIALRWLAQDITERKESERLRHEAVLQERNRIAQELHDTLAQGFVGIAVQLELAKATLKDSPAKAEEAILYAQALARESLTETRRSVRALRSQQLIDSDLVEAFRRLAAEVSKRTRIQAQFRSRGQSRRLSPLLENDLLRIGQEASTNVLRHAQAQHLLIELTFEADQVSLRITDDGCSFAPDSVSAQDGLGLQGMRERAQRHGGYLRLSNTNGRGTVVEATLPLSAPEPIRRET